MRESAVEKARSHPSLFFFIISSCARLFIMFSWSLITSSAAVGIMMVIVVLYLWIGALEMRALFSR